MSAPAATIAQFRTSLIGLHIDTDGLTRQNRLQRLELVAALTYEVLAVTRDATTPQELLVNRLAHCTQRLLTTVVEADPKAVQAYVLARAELIELDENTRPGSKYNG